MRVLRTVYSRMYIHLPLGADALLCELHFLEKLVNGLVLFLHLN